MIGAMMMEGKFVPAIAREHRECCFTMVNISSRKSRRATARRTQRRSAKASQRRGGDGLVDQMTDTLNLGKSCWEQGQRNDALELYERAVKETPNNVRAYILTARAYAERYSLKELEVMLGRLRRLAPKHPGVHHFIGETYALTNLPQRAMDAYEAACGLPGVQPGTWMELASLYERSHRLDEARALIDRAAQMGLRLPLLGLVKARIERREKRADAAERILRAMVENLPADSDWACQAWAEIAQIKDKQGDYDGAIEAVERCKREQLNKCAKEQAASDTVLKRFGVMVEDIAQSDFHRWRNETADLLDTRTAILTGFPRSGTTLLEQVLDAHEDLVSSEERDFLGKEQFRSLQQPNQRRGPILEVLNGLSIDRIRTEQRRYFEVMEHLLGEVVDGRMHLDKNPAYNSLLPLVLRLLPQTRVIVALRDPRDVVLSCFLRYLPLNPVSVSFLSLQRTAERYAVDMTAWLKFREIIHTPWCEVRYEDSVSDLQTQARRALETLGLPWDENVLNYRRRLGKERQVSSPTYEAVSKPVYSSSIGRWKHYEKYFGSAFETLEPFVKAFGYE